MELSSRFGNKFEDNINMFGVIKEVGVDTEGLLEFQSKYFGDNEIYFDEKKEFYHALGNQSLLSQRLHSWNPFQLYTDFNKMKDRMKNKKIEGNLIGEGLLKGGLFIVSPTEGVVYEHHESSGSPMPYEEIEAMVAKLTKRDPAVPFGKRTDTTTRALPVCTSRDTCGDT